MVSAGKEKRKELEVVSVELPAPEGWVKKFTPKQGGTPRRNEVVFISPTGEEIKNRRQLDQFLRSHPGGPPSSSFDWGTGDTPRRSARISDKAKVSPEAEKPKRVSRSSEKETTSPKIEKRKRVSRSNEKAEKASGEKKVNQGSSSNKQKGTKRKKKTENSEDEGHKAEAESDSDQGDGPKSGDKDVAKGLKKGGKRRKTAKDEEHKAQEEGHSTKGEGPNDVDIVDTEGTKLTQPTLAGTIRIQNLVDHTERTERTEGDEKTEEKEDEKVEQDDVQLDGKGEYFEEALKDAKASPTAAPKDVDMEEATNENIEDSVDKINPVLADQAGDNDEIEEDKSADHIIFEEEDKAKESVQETTIEAVGGLDEPELTVDKTEKASQGVIQHELVMTIEENIEETVEYAVDGPGEVDQDSADKAIENNTMEESEIFYDTNELEPDDTTVVTQQETVDITIEIAKDVVDLTHKDGEAPGSKKVEAASEASEKSGNKDKAEVKTGEKSNNTEAFQPTSVTTFSENGGKGEESINARNDYLHEYDGKNVQIDPPPSDW